VNEQYIYLAVAVIVVIIVAVVLRQRKKDAEDELAPWEFNIGNRSLTGLVIPLGEKPVHYVTMPCGPLKMGIKLRFRIDADPGVKLVPRSAPKAPTMLTLYFQRAGDDWSGQGEFEAHRWYAAYMKVSPIPVWSGESSIWATFDGNWSAVLTSTREKNPQAFKDALANAARVGFVLGGGTGLGHGVIATGPAKLTVLEFKVG
jgi:hypothetical protein